MSQPTDSVLYTFQIQPILNDGVPGNAGGFIELSNGQRVDSINFQLVLDTGIFTMSYQGVNVTDMDEIRLTKLKVPNNILNPINQSTFSFVIKGNKEYNLSNPILDIFREGDIFRGYYQSLDDDSPVPLLVGEIENVNISYSLAGTQISLTVGGLLNILARSQMVQTSKDQSVGGNIITSIAPNLTQFGTFLDGILSETYINQTAVSTKYYIGEGEEIASQKVVRDNPTISTGSGLVADTFIYIVFPPTGSKLQAILMAIYPYQRVIYVDTDATLKISPLSTYYDNNANWILSMNPTESSSDGFIKCENIRIHKNSALIYNRSYYAINQALIAINKSTALSALQGAHTGVAVAVPKKAIFKRAYDFVKSGLGLQTNFGVMPVDMNSVAQNSGLLASGKNINNIPGMTMGVDVTSDYSGMSSTAPDANVKYVISLYAARSLAQSLLSDMLIDVTVPLVSTYDKVAGKYRKIPLNQMVKVPSVTNNLYDGQEEMFCYGFQLNFDVKSGSKLTLQLCKPYVFTALWANELVEI